MASSCPICETLTPIVCHAIPTSISTASIAARDDAALVPGLYGNSGRPEIDDLVRGESARLSYQLYLTTSAMDVAIPEFLGDGSGEYVQWFSGGRPVSKYSKLLHPADSLLRIRHRFEAIQSSAIWVPQVSASLGGIVVSQCR